VPAENSFVVEANVAGTQCSQRIMNEYKCAFVSG
jgi:hypothetical protein